MNLEELDLPILLDRYEDAIRHEMACEHAKDACQQAELGKALEVAQEAYHKASAAVNVYRGEVLRRVVAGMR